MAGSCLKRRCAGPGIVAAAAGVVSGPLKREPGGGHCDEEHSESAAARLP